MEFENIRFALTNLQSWIAKIDYYDSQMDGVNSLDDLHIKLIGAKTTWLDLSAEAESLVKTTLITYYRNKKSQAIAEFTELLTTFADAASNSSGSYLYFNKNEQPPRPVQSRCFRSGH